MAALGMLSAAVEHNARLMRDLGTTQVVRNGLASGLIRVGPCHRERMLDVRDVLQALHDGTVVVDAEEMAVLVAAELVASGRDLDAGVEVVRVGEVAVPIVRSVALG